MGPSALEPGKSLADGEELVALGGQGPGKARAAGRAGAVPEGVGASLPRESVYRVTLFLCGLVLEGMVWPAGHR